MSKSPAEVLSNLRASFDTFIEKPCPETWASVKAWLDAMEMLPNPTVEELMIPLELIQKAQGHITGAAYITLWEELYKVFSIWELRLSRLLAGLTTSLS